MSATTTPQHDAAMLPHWWSHLLLGVSLALALRIGLGVIMGATWFALEAYLPPSLPPSIYGGLQMPESRIGSLLLGVWLRWDAVHHLALAMRGYSEVSPGDSVFYPLYAALTRVVAAAIGGNFIGAGLLVSTFSAVIAFTCLAIIGADAFGPESGKWAAIGLAAYPTAVFLVAPFAESLFLALALLAILLAGRKHWLLAAVPGLLASLTRGPGILLSVPLAVIAARRLGSPHERRDLASLAPMIAAIAAPMAGGLAFIGWRSLAGFPPMALALRDYSHISFVDPLTGFTSAVRQWVVTLDLPTTLDTLSAILFLAATVMMAIRPRWRKPEMLAYMIVSLGVFLSVRVEGATSLRSMSRYVLSLFPAFLMYGDFLATARPRLRFLCLLMSSTLLIVLSALYALWFFIG